MNLILYKLVIQPCREKALELLTVQLSMTQSEEKYSNCNEQSFVSSTIEITIQKLLQ